MPTLLISLPDQQAEDLDTLAKRQHCSPSEFISDLIQKAKDATPRPRQANMESNVFGIWKGREVDGLAWQEAMRSEW